MGVREWLLTVVPVVMGLLLVIGATLRATGQLQDVSLLMGKSNSGAIKETSLSLETGTDDAASCTTCPDMITSLNCADSSIPVLGGVDVIQYWTDFKNADGTYDESQIGQLGIPSYQSTYNNFQFNFISAENQQLFESDPATYAPQFGGFCAWGVGGEFCPTYPWAADCLGPSGNWGHWTIQENKLFFFYKEEAKEKFTADVTLYAASGALRWSEWFTSDSATPLGYFSTKCFISAVNDDEATNTTTSRKTRR